MKYFFTRIGLVPIFLLCFTVLAVSQTSIKGNVQDASGEPLIGVSILVKSTSTGTVTDFDGNFDLQVPEGSTILVLSYTGFRTQEVDISGGNTNLNLVMAYDVARLDEVVVTGLASGVRRSNSGNAIETVSGEELTGTTNQQTLDGALNGKIAGVNISSNSGAPGGGISASLRGISTLGAGSSQPLYVIDGVLIDNSVIRTGRTQVNGASGGSSAATQDDAANRIADINPDDIEKVEVLKGPSAAAIYGTRANAGVIIITTKKGQSGKTKFSFSQDIGVARGQNFQHFDNWDAAKIDAYYGGDPDELAKFQAAQQAGTIVDWEEELYGETPILSNTQLRLSGGSDKTQFYISGGALTEDGIVKGTGFDRYTARVNLDHRISDRVKVSVNTTYMKTDNDRGFTGNQNNTGGSLGYTIAYTPNYASLQPDENGNYPDNPYFSDNPYAIRDLSKNNQKVDRFMSAGEVDIDLYRSTSSYLKFKVNGGVDYLSGNSIVYFPEILQHQRANPNAGDVMWGRQDNLNYNIQGALIFNADIGNLNSNTIIGAVQINQESEFLLERARGLTGGEDNLNWGVVTNVQAQQQAPQVDKGLIFQEDLNWRDRFSASVGVRLDKSSLNLQANKFYAYPKASVALNLHNFDFWGVDAISQFKLRAAYGETGGLPLFGSIYEALVPQLIGSNLGGQVGTRGVDPNLQPERAKEIEFGIDLGFFNNNVTLEATYFNKTVEDLILDLKTAEATGILAIATNAAELTNTGIELTLGINAIKSTNFNWYTRLMYWSIQSEITSLIVPSYTQGGFGPSLGTYLLAEGYSPTTLVGLPSGTDVPAGGFTVYGDRQPDFQASWYNQFTFLKNFEFTFLGHYQKGGVGVNLTALLWDEGGSTPDWDGDADGDGVGNGNDRITEWAGGNSGVYIQQTDYIKLREAGLYYTFPKSVFGGVVQRLKFGVSANNLLLWTNYGSYDPEVSNFGTQAITGSIEVAPYPSSRRFFFHLKADF